MSKAKSNSLQSGRPIIVITGPTASGKSDIALMLCQKFNGFIINADSRQVYRELKIGSAQPVPDKVESNGTWYIDGIKHFLYGFLDLEDSYNIARYQSDVKTILEREKKEIPFLVGGTGLFIDSVILNYQLKLEEDLESAQLRKERERLTVAQLQALVPDKLLSQLNNSDRNNPHRLIRILERGAIASIKNAPKYKYLYLVVDPGIDAVKANIVKRTAQMFESGLVEENQGLLEEGFTYNTPALNTIGYIEFKEYFTNNKSLAEIKQEIMLHTRQYAKRQRTWFRRHTEAVYVKTYEEARELVADFLKQA